MLSSSARGSAQGHIQWQRWDLMLFGKRLGSWGEGGAGGGHGPSEAVGNGWRSGAHGLGPRLTSWSRQS